MLLVIQYWQGDREAALRTARLIADVQPEPTKKHYIMFAHRFDAEPPDVETLAYVKRKFDIFGVHKGRRKEVGWPAGCNGLAHDVIQLAGEQRRVGNWQSVDGVWLLESDILPLNRHWLHMAAQEWEWAQKEGKLVLGAWSPHHGVDGHVNGNMIFHPDLWIRVPGLEGSAPHIGWDVYHANRLKRHWKKSTQMINLYRATEVTAEALWPDRGPYIFVHGIKDDSGYNLVRERLLGERSCENTTAVV